MTHPFRPIHRLHSIEARLVLPVEGEPQAFGLAVHGRSETKRGNLWSYQELFTPELDHQKGYSVADALHHVALVCIQDRPNSLERLNFALRGGLAYHEDEMFPGWGAE